MQKIRHKFWVPVAGIGLFAAVFLSAGQSLGPRALAASAEEVCGHVYGEGIVHEPDCTSGGFTEYTCILCGESYKDNFTEKTEHTYSEVTVAPTCTHEGYTTHFCTTCGYGYTDNYVAALGHSYTDTATEPTCTQAGFTTHTCTVCGYSYTDEYMAAPGHNYAAEVTEPTCTEGGYTIYTCTVCGDTYVSEYTEEKGHAYTERKVFATCVMYGYTEHLCTDCGDRFVTDYVRPLGHDFLSERVEATEEGIGYTKYTCQNCDYSYVTEFVTSGDNGYTDGESPSEPPEEGGDEHEHSYTPEIVVDESQGIFTVTDRCACGDEKTANVRVYAINEADERMLLAADPDGIYEYSGLYESGWKEIVVYDISGEEIGRFTLPEEEPPHEHEHTFTVYSELHIEEKYILLHGECDCGEASGKLYLVLTDTAGGVVIRGTNEAGRVELSGLSGVYPAEIRDGAGNILSAFTLDLTPPDDGEEEEQEPGEGSDEEPGDESDTEDTPEDSSDDSQDVSMSETERENKNIGLIAGLGAGAGILAAAGIAVAAVIKNRKDKDKNKK